MTAHASRSDQSQRLQRTLFWLVSAQFLYVRAKLSVNQSLSEVPDDIDNVGIRHYNKEQHQENNKIMREEEEEGSRKVARMRKYQI